MAKSTNISLRKQIIYSIFVRNFSEEGTFKGVEPQLDRIKALGVDVIWFLPIYPIGEKNRKGADGSPYAIKDYRAVDPNYGTLDEFKELCKAIHQRGMKVMIDIVYNHTAPDSVLVQEHPEWFFRKPNGEMGNQVGDWSDIVDLDYQHQGLWEYQIETLKQWAEIVDGFRCDVAPLVPVEFWQRAREAVAEVKQDVIWLTESVELNFIRELRAANVLAQSDCEMYQAFDITYDYDVRHLFVAYLAGEVPLSRYVDFLNLQDVIYPANYVKLRNIENHDNLRAKALIPDEEQLLQWTAFTYLQKGATLIYNGQEVQAEKVPSLFERDLIDWQKGRNISGELQKLAALKREWIPVDGNYFITAFDEVDAAVIRYETEQQDVMVIVSFKGKDGVVTVPLEDGTYRNLYNNREVCVKNNEVNLEKQAIVLAVNKD